MAQDDIGAFSLDGGNVTATVTFNAANLQVQQVTFQNLTAFNAVITVKNGAAPQNTYILPANTPSGQRGVGNDHIQLVNRTITKGGVQVTFVDWPDGWSMETRWPA